jgi:hypothetical protein
MNPTPLVPFFPEQSARKTWLLVDKIFEAAGRVSLSRGDLCGSVPCHYAYVNALFAGKAYKAPPKEVDPYDLGERFDEMGKDFVEPISQRLGIPYLDLTATLPAMIRKTGRSHHFIVDNHYNATRSRSRDRGARRLDGEPVEGGERKGHKSRGSDHCITPGI